MISSGISSGSSVRTAEPPRVAGSSGRHHLADQGPFQRFPCAGRGEDVARANDQVAAIGRVQRAGPDQGEVGNDGPAAPRLMLHASQQARQGGVQLDDDGALPS